MAVNSVASDLQQRADAAAFLLLRVVQKPRNNPHKLFNSNAESLTTPSPSRLFFR
jgi:hypothetical protein